MDVPDDAVTDTTPVPLSQAIRLFFPLGGVTKSSLRNEARKGRLVIERIANKHFVTRKAINDMRRKCEIARDTPPPSPSKSRPPVLSDNDPSIQRANEMIRRLKQGEPMPGQQSVISADITVLRTRDR